MRVDEQRQDVLVPEAPKSWGNVVLQLPVLQVESVSVDALAAELQLSLYQLPNVFLPC